MFKIHKEYPNGGKVLIHKTINKKGSDYKPLVNIANFFAKEGRTTKLMPTLHFKSEEYKEIFSSLIGTIYERKCPDLQIDGQFYEFENYNPPFKIRKISNMISHGAKQSPRIIINNTKGASDRYIRRQISERLDDKHFKYKIDKVWVYEKGKLRLLFKIQ
ncbi:hypothetical protein FACS189446_3510 [Bacteroidia bacterium]|nr:hypothetical protein FACS189446_3510 [Bacteroidia bacterium]